MTTVLRNAALNILVIEDDADELQRCASLISGIRPGITIIPAQNGGEALRLARQKRIDAAFIDRGLPDIDGFDLAAKITESDTYLVLPIIFVTGTDGDSLAMREKYHHYAYIAKPYTSNRFLEVATSFLNGIANSKKRILDDEKGKDRVVLVVSEGIEYPIKQTDILYAEVQGHVISLHTKQQMLSPIRMDMATFVENVNDPNFVRCHRAYAVNISNIHSIAPASRRTWDICFDASGETKCLLSNFYKNAVQQILRPEQG